MRALNVCFLYPLFLSPYPYPLILGGIQVYLWWVKDVWFFNPLSDPLIRPLFGSSGVRCHICQSSVSLMGQSKKGPRRVLG